VADDFTMSNEVAESNSDQDLGSGGELILPDLIDSTNTVRHLVVGAGKDGNIYVVNRDSMGKFNAGSNNIWNQLSGVLRGGIGRTPPGGAANGPDNGIVWTHQNSSPQAVLHAYDASNLAHELYNSSQAANNR